MLLLWAIFGLAWAHEKIPGQSAKIDPHTVLVLWGTRHGNRNPESFVTKDPTVWGFEGPVELTSFGKRQAYGLGAEIRKFVGHLLNANYLPKEAKFYSSSANRCQMTLQAALAGLYTPVGWGDWETKKFDHWSPVPYTIDDPLLRMYAVSNCPKSDEAWKPISEDTLPDLKNLTEEHKELLEYIGKSTGWKPSISSAADLADNIIEIQLYKTQYPDFIEKPTLKGYNKAKLIDAIMEFAENHQIKCADYKPCRDLMGGVWLKHIIDSMEKAQKGEGPKVIGYASHTEVTLAVMKLLGIDKKEITTSAGFVVEFRNKPSNDVRLLIHDPNPIDKHVIYRAKYTSQIEKISSIEGWIPLAKLKDAVKNNFISDWEGACGRETCKKD